MKELSNAAPFRWVNLPPPSYSEGMEFYHQSSRRNYRMRQPPPDPVSDLLRIDCFCEVHLLRGAHYLRRHAPFLSIEYVREGTLLVRQRGRMYELEQGELFLMQPEIENEFLSGEGGCRKISVMLKGRVLPAMLGESGLDRVNVLSRRSHSPMERLFREISELAGEHSVKEPGRNARLAFELLQALRLPADDSEFPPLLSGLRDALEQNPQYCWNQTVMAARCGCSPTHLVRLFHRYFHTTPRQFLLDLRIRHARQLLADETLSIKEIAAAVGYDSALNFSTSFRKRFGISPREYRKQLSIFS